MKLARSIDAVDPSVAVVVDAVSAVLGAAGTSGVAGAVGIGAVCEAVTVVVEAVVADCLRSGTSRAKTADTAGLASAVSIRTVGQPVGIVVESVGTDRFRAHASRADAADAASLTVADRVRTVGQAVAVVVDEVRADLGRTNAERAGSAVRIRAVSEAVTVVVQAVVAHLDDCSLERITELGSPANAVLNRVVAHAQTAGGCPQTFVRLPVAVVVDPVADFNLRPLHGVANLGNAADTVVNRVVALPKSASGRPEAFIDRSVTVIVEAVADFRDGEHCLLTRADAYCAVIRTCRADTQRSLDRTGSARIE